MKKPHVMVDFHGTLSGKHRPDLLFFKNGNPVGVEYKRADAPSMHIALEDLKLPRPFVVYPGDISYDLSDKIRVVAFKEMLSVFGGTAAY